MATKEKKKRKQRRPATTSKKKSSEKDVLKGGIEEETYDLLGSDGETWTKKEDFRKVQKLRLVFGVKGLTLEQCEVFAFDHIKTIQQRRIVFIAELDWSDNQDTTVWSVRDVEVTKEALNQLRQFCKEKNVKFQASWILCLCD